MNTKMDDSMDLKTKEYFGVLNFGLESVDFFQPFFLRQSVTFQQIPTNSTKPFTTQYDLKAWK